MMSQHDEPFHMFSVTLHWVLIVLSNLTSDFSRYMIVNMGYHGWGLLLILTDVYTSLILYPQNSGGWQHSREEGLSGLQVSFHLSMILITLDSPHT